MRPAPTHSACAPLNPKPLRKWLKDDAPDPTIPAATRVMELAAEAFPGTDWQVGVTFDGNDPVFWGRVSPTVCVCLTFRGGRPREGRAVMYRIKKGTWLPRSKKPVDVVLDDPIDALSPHDLVGWFSWAKTKLDEGKTK